MDYMEGPSRVNRTPPSGLPKATDTPAAAAAASILLFSTGQLQLRKTRLRVTPPSFPRNFLNRFNVIYAKQHETWTSGPLKKSKEDLFGC
jgi:hypothetical protein